MNVVCVIFTLALALLLVELRLALPPHPSSVTKES
jgi:hypothetical protein